MTKRIEGFVGMAAELVAAEVEVVEFLGRGLERVLVKIEGTAKKEFGVYQAAAGDFPEWAQLAEATQADRVAKGFPANEPLLRTGESRDSIEHERQGLEGAVGSTSDLMPYHELGTSHIPARPVLGPAAFRNKAVIEKLVGAAVVAGLIGQSEIDKVLGYDFETSD